MAEQKVQRQIVPHHDYMNSLKVKTLTIAKYSKQGGLVVYLADFNPDSPGLTLACGNLPKMIS